MDLWHFIRGIFGGRDFGTSNDERFFDQSERFHRDVFDNSIWYDNADNIDTDSRYFNRQGHFHIFSNPLEITRYFESQIDNMLKNFISGFHNEDHSPNMLPFSSPEEENLRGRMLKPNSDNMLKKLDTDLDGKITADNFSNIWEDQSKSKLEVSRPHVFGKFTRKEYIRRPDGSIEEKQITRDHEGNEETIISQRIGDKMHVIVTKKDKNGIESKTENFFDSNECEPNRIKALAPNEKPDTDFKSFPWDKFFKFDPKL